MGMAYLQRRNKLIGSMIAVEEGNFTMDNGAMADQRLLCETHGDSFPHVTYNGSFLYLPKAERLVAIKRPWTWCRGCAVAYEETMKPPENWFYEKLGDDRG